jgi:hypothetical protein
MHVSSKRPQGPAIRTLPVDPTTGKSPEVLLHAVVANLKPTETGPAKRLLLVTATAQISLFLLPTFFSERFLGRRVIHFGVGKPGFSQIYHWHRGILKTQDNPRTVVSALFEYT